MTGSTSADLMSVSCSILVLGGFVFYLDYVMTGVCVYCDVEQMVL